MIKPGLIDTQLGNALDLKMLIQDAVSFFSKSFDIVKISDRDTSVFKNIKNFGNPYMNGLFSSIVESDKIDLFQFFDYSRLVKNNTNIPELLTISALTIDGLYTGLQLDNRLKKIWCNITPYVKKKSYETERIEFTDVDKVHEAIVRGALCRSYQEHNRWLTSDIAALVIESYALTIGNILSSAYKLSVQDSNMVVLLFAAYYSQLFNTEGSMRAPELLVKCKKLNQMGIDVTTLSYINKFRANPDVLLSIHEICSILSQHGPVKLASLNSRILSSLFSKGTVDIQIMLIALEYPPYYVMQLLRLADNYKNYTLTANPNNKKTGQLLAEKLRIESTFIPQL